jgi:transposase
MGKHRYKTVGFKALDWAGLSERLAGRRVVFSIDVAKDDFYAALMTAEDALEALIKWVHPRETTALLAHLSALAQVAQVEVVMEPSGTYGDALRWQLTQRGLGVWRMGPKRVHDAAEVYDGVPSLHDAKAAYLIGRLHWQGVSRPWREADAERRALLAEVSLVDLYKARHQAGTNRLEAQLSRHWPEVLRVLGCKSVTLARLLAQYGDAAHVAADETRARELMRHSGRSVLGAERIEAVLASARTTLGVPCVEAERCLVQELARDVIETAKRLREAERTLERRANEDATLTRLSAVVGVTSSAVLMATQGRPQDYSSPASYVKGLGLNLKERSSGKHVGQLKLTKRGPGVARHYLYFAALRQIRRDPEIRRWYQARIQRPGAVRGKSVVALMRKLAQGLWHVARGQPFEPGKLFDSKPQAGAA